MHRNYKTGNKIESDMTTKHRCCRPFPLAQETEFASVEEASLTQLPLQHYLIWSAEEGLENPVSETCRVLLCETFLRLLGNRSRCLHPWERYGGEFFLFAHLLEVALCHLVTRVTET